MESETQSNDPQAILAYLKKTATEDLKLTQDQIDAIRPEVQIADGLSLDSLAQTVLVSKIENDFGIMFEPEDLQQVRTVEDLVRLIIRYTAEKQA
jgi:acyl carrier protein